MFFLCNYSQNSLRNRNLRGLETAGISVQNSDTSTFCNLVSMQRFTSITLLSVYGLVSILGHAGFDVLGLHSHGKHGATCEHSTLKCSHCHHSHKTVRCTEDDSRTSSEHPDDCMLCKCFALLKMQVVASSLSTATFVPFFCESFAAYERLVAFDFTFRPRLRGPPANQV